MGKLLVGPTTGSVLCRCQNREEISVPGSRYTCVGFLQENGGLL